ncbi:hypothetical protein GJ744_011240 [Endocarpon pusillum]|uniref:Protein kinase domain-containing protein n=1 Tax=Endocarpon pusillum TaxID=364733 RepID=A0A8H7ASY2_9EURO|nr:hypothetical protein GJ744_011240 [Endocarpon pusillum]
MENPWQREETASESVAGNDESPASNDWLPDTAEQHATLLTSSLLEFAYNVKAAEHLNHVRGTNRFHRESPEARALGAVMYQGASIVLASHGIIADCVHEEDWRQLRQQYLAGVDNLGLQAFNESLSHQDNSRRSRPTGEGNKVLVRHPSRSRQEFLSVLSSKYLPGQLVDTNQYRGMMDAMTRSLVVPSPDASMQLSLPPAAAGCSRYKAEFCELKRLGKGGFGTVYHVKNFVDNQDYAVKKIPLDPRRMKQWQTSGAKEVEALLKEIRTLARLEHANIVRYYSAWIEGADESTNTPTTVRRPHQLYLEDNAASTYLSTLDNDERQDEDSNDIVFTKDSPRDCPDMRNGALDDSMGIVFGRDSGSLSQYTQSEQQLPVQQSQHRSRSHDHDCRRPSTSNETDIFTDGNCEVLSRKSKKNDELGQLKMVLHIQMSLHPLSLSTYLAHSETSSYPSPRHCFHLKPSLHLIRAILSGVENLHSQGIIHRDIKPGNIFLSEHNECDQRPGCVEVSCTDCEQSKTKRYLNPRLGDFGLVADISRLSDEESVPTSKHTSKAVGTELYRPPPIAGHQDYSHAIDEKIDVFALGILLFELLWRMNTKMERHMLLTDLAKKATLPPHFAKKIDPRDKPYRIKNQVHDRAEFDTVGDCVEDCIRNMVATSPAERWGCARVRERLDDLIGAME